MFGGIFLDVKFVQEIPSNSISFFYLLWPQKISPQSLLLEKSGKLPPMIMSFNKVFGEALKLSVIFEIARVKNGCLRVVVIGYFSKKNWALLSHSF